jgi:lipoteichoic acid synthase
MHRRPLAGSDGVQLQWIAHTASGDRLLATRELALYRTVNERRWRDESVHIPAGAERLTIVAVPGPPGSTNWNDRVFLSVTDVTTGAQRLARAADAVALTALLYAVAAAAYGLGAVSLPSAAVPVVQTVALGAVLWLSLFLMRLFTFGIPAADCSAVGRCAAAVLGRTQQDTAYVVLVTTIAAFAAWTFAARPRGSRAVTALFVTVSLFSVAVSVANREVWRTLGGPFNYQWLYYSEFLAGDTARTSLMAYVTPELVAALAAGLLLFGAAAILALAVSRRYAAPQPAAWLATAVVAAAGLLLAPGTQGSARAAGGSESFNPVMSFVESVVATSNGARLFTMPTATGTTDFEMHARVEPQRAAAAATASPIRHVIVFVLESVAAQYIVGEHVVAAAVPELTRYRRQAVTFPNTYAHAPASNTSLVSILTSAYPLISYKSLTQVDPAVPLESLGTVLRERGYRTGFFSSGDTRFQRGLEFVAHHGFDTRASYKELRCDAAAFHYSNNEWPHQDSLPDACMLDAFTSWAGDRGTAPFLAVLWPVQTHHPYRVAGEQVNFGVPTEDFNRYLNALHETDRVFGAMMRWLQAGGLADSTLVVVVGDHGEAFGQHGNLIHASDIYDENVRVPLLLINPGLYSGEINEAVAGLVDVAPTIADVLGIPSAASWQGRSVFERDRSGRAYFFSPYSRYLFGLRQANLKMVLDGESDRARVYDLSVDPGETHDIAGDMPEFVRNGEARLAAWVQYQVSRYDRLLHASGGDSLAPETER